MAIHLYMLLTAGLAVGQAPSTSSAQAAQAQTPAAPAGPMAPERYKDIQVLTDVPADQLVATMRYFVIATGIQCNGCHQTDAATGQLNPAADSRGKTTARGMINLVKTVNAGSFGARINCATCHAGRNQPAGLPLAQTMTPEQIAQAVQAAAARQGGAGGPGAPAQGQAGRGQLPAVPPVNEVIAKYLDAVGGEAAAGRLQSRFVSGTLVNRAGQTLPFTIEQSGNRFRYGVEGAAPVARGFDGSEGWSKNGDRVSTLAGWDLSEAQAFADLMLPTQLKASTNLQGGRGARLPGAAPGSTVTANIVQRSLSPTTTERLFFDSSTGLLRRRQIITRTPLNGVLTEQFDYSDYRAEAGVQMPHTIVFNNWNTLDTLTITSVKVNVPVDEARTSRPK
jgi:Photosynthetic reaction centre cytochrome C subunit